MIVEVGHAHPVDGSVITQTRLSDETNENGDFVVSYTTGTDGQEVRDHLFDNPGMVSHLPGNTAILDVVKPIRERLNGKPDWVAVVPEERSPELADDFERFLAEFFRCEKGKPHDVEDTHWTLHNGEVFAPGSAPEE